MKLDYLINRLAQTLLTMFLVSLITFSFLAVLPGDPVTLMIGPDNAATMSAEEIELAKARLGLDKPIPVQYLTWIGGILTGDWGESIRTRRPVLESIKSRAPVTLQLAALSFAIAMMIAIPSGVVAALNRNSWFDRLSTIWAVGGVAMPNFWLAVLLILLFAVRLDWLPASGYVDPLDSPWEAAKRLILPAFVLGSAQSATIMRQTRSSMLEVLNQDYIRTARAKGLSPGAVILGHALRNALLPVLTIIGLRLGNLLGGSIIIETVFALPGMGRLAVTAIFFKDFPVVMGFVLLIGLTVPLANLLTDIAYGLVDPRIQLGTGEA